MEENTNEKAKKRNKIIGITIGLVIVAIVAVSISYAYWQVTKTQQDKNTMISACLDLDLTSETEGIKLQSAIPITDAEAALLTGYTFKVTNKCSYDIKYTIGLDALESANNNYMDFKYVDVKLDDNAKSNYAVLEDVVRDGVRASKKLSVAKVKANAANAHTLRAWIDVNTPVDQNAKSFKGKIYITATQADNQKKITNYGAELASGDVSRDSSSSVTYTVYDSGTLVYSGEGKALTTEGYMFFENIYFPLVGLTDEEKAYNDTNESVDVMQLILFASYVNNLNDDEWKTVMGDDSLTAETAKAQIAEMINASSNPTLAKSIYDKCLAVNINKVVLEDGITAISAGMFPLFVDTIEIPASVIEMESMSFSSVEIRNLTIPETVTTFADALDFATIYNLTINASISNITLNGTYNTLKFSNNTGLTTVSFDDFNVKKLYIPSTVTTMNYTNGINDKQNVELYMYGPQRTITGLTESEFKSVTWNYTE